MAASLRVLVALGICCCVAVLASSSALRFADLEGDYVSTMHGGCELSLRADSTFASQNSGVLLASPAASERSAVPDSGRRLRRFLPLHSSGHRTAQARCRVRASLLATAVAAAGWR
jgi:hypothetical protein